MKILLGVTSSIAAYRTPNLVSQFKKQGHEVKCMISEAAKAFVAPQALAVMSQNPCFTDSDEWKNTPEVLHIQLAKWCDVCLLAPLSANTLAKISNGLCDNLLTSTIRALGKTALILAPAMNTRMWENPLTTIQFEQVKKFYNVTVIDPVEKRLADGDEGIGGLAEDNTIIETINKIKL
ncbi:MAG: phosphopantothenoylcysteine decarboxylase [Calditrichae bacterium]|nr:phosphopantothenoylcysteine decarboxylase [Calditrichota bacterium]MCB9059444.1 phosphopantothenoylcysteine decarboxylase [Calditrichia bacterium]